MHITVLMASVIAMLFEIRSLRKQNKYREIAFSASFFTVGLVLGTLTYFKVKIPSPLFAINTIFKPINQFITKLLVE